MSLLALEQFANLFDPSVAEIFQVGYKSVTDFASSVMKQEDLDISELSVKSRQYAGPGAWNQRDDGLPPLFDTMFESYGVELTTEEYKNWIQATLRMIEKDKMAGRDILKQARDLGRGAALKRQQTAAALYNDSFTSDVGGDGVSLINASHPYATKSPEYGSVQSNVISGALTDTTLATSRTTIMAQEDEQGERFLDEETLDLVVSSSIADAAMRLVDTRAFDRPNTANRDFNVHVGRYNLKVWNRLTSGYWFVQHPEHKIMIYDRVKPGVSEPIITDAHVLKWSGRASWVCGYHDWRGIVGSAG